MGSERNDTLAMNQKIYSGHKCAKRTNHYGQARSVLGHYPLCRGVISRHFGIHK